MDTCQNNRLQERRRFPRYDVDEGSLFSDQGQLIGFGRVINLSKCGARCVSLSITRSISGFIDNVELYIPDLSLDLKNLSGRVIEFTRIRQPSGDHYIQALCEFSFDFQPHCRDTIPDLHEIRSLSLPTPSDPFG